MTDSRDQMTAAPPPKPEDPYVAVLNRCAMIRRKKSSDYQNSRSTIRQADYYPSGLTTLNDIIHAKLLRARSLVESGVDPSNESLLDTYQDMINYCAFAVMWCEGNVDGQGDRR